MVESLQGPCFYWADYEVNSENIVKVGDARIFFTGSALSEEPESLPTPQQSCSVEISW